MLGKHVKAFRAPLAACLAAGVPAGLARRPSDRQRPSTARLIRVRRCPSDRCWRRRRTVVALRAVRARHVRASAPKNSWSLDTKPPFPTRFGLPDPAGFGTDAKGRVRFSPRHGSENLALRPGCYSGMPVLGQLRSAVSRRASRSGVVVDRGDG